MRHTGTSAAQLDPVPEADCSLADAPLEPFALRQQVADRVAAHRARHNRAPASAAPAATPSENPRPSRGRHAQIAGAVAERYAQAQSYRSFLASEAERSVRQAEAVAEVATINARAIANAQQQLLADLDQWDLPTDRDPVATAAIQSGLVSAATLQTAAQADSATASSSLSQPAIRTYTVRLPEELSQPPLYANGSVIAAHRQVPDEIDFEEASALDDEIAFRHAPAIDEAPIESLPLSANLIEFPRQLIASRKARPRLAEGPLREDTGIDDGQLRIFEVDAAQLDQAVAPTAAAGAPEWSSILLAPQPAVEYLTHDASTFAPTVVPQVAPISRRLMAALVDGTTVLATAAASLAVFVQIVTRLSPAHAALHVSLPVAAIVLTGSAVALGALYLLLFFTFADATPGMRYARIALCTFTDENPTRTAMRRRLLSMAGAALPLGLGLLWAFLDEDNLAWHDRLSRMYQRSY